MQSYFNPFFFSKYQCVFRQGHSSQTCPPMIERCSACPDNSKIGGVILADLSKCFDCMSHDLIIVKLVGYWLAKNLRFI